MLVSVSQTIYFIITLLLDFFYKSTNAFRRQSPNTVHWISAGKIRWISIGYAGLCYGLKPDSRGWEGTDGF